MTPWAIINPARLAGPGLLRTQSDSRLVDLVRAGNDRAFEAIVLRYHRPLLRHCRRLLPAGRAEDAVQQTLLSALEAMRSDERELQLGPWLHRIAHNTAIDSLRRMDSHWEVYDERIDGVEPTHAAAERRARFHGVIADIGTLPDRQRRALVLRELEGRSYDEIAVALGVTDHGVRQLLNRARNAMRAAAGALVPTALVGRTVGSQAGVRIAELVDPPGTALVAKATAALAAGAVALFAVTGAPSGGGGAVPHAEAAPSPRGADVQGQPVRGSAAVRADDPRAGRSDSRRRPEPGSGAGKARRDAVSPDGAPAGGGRLAAEAPTSERKADAIGTGAGGGTTGTGGGLTGVGGGQTRAADGPSGTGDDDDDASTGIGDDDDDAPAGIDDEMDDDAADGGGAADDGEAPAGGEAGGGDDEPDDGGGQPAAAGTTAPDGEDDDAPEPMARVQVTASPVTADEDDGDVDE